MLAADGRPVRAGKVDVRDEFGAGVGFPGLAVRAVDDVAELLELLGGEDLVGIVGRAVALNVELRQRCRWGRNVTQMVVDMVL